MASPSPFNPNCARILSFCFILACFFFFLLASASMFPCNSSISLSKRSFSSSGTAALFSLFSSSSSSLAFVVVLGFTFLSSIPNRFLTCKRHFNNILKSLLFKTPKSRKSVRISSFVSSHASKSINPSFGGTTFVPFFPFPPSKIKQWYIPNISAGFSFVIKFSAYVSLYSECNPSS